VKHRPAAPARPAALRSTPSLIDIASFDDIQQDRPTAE
jgi:hypothetical protein